MAQAALKARSYRLMEEVETEIIVGPGAVRVLSEKLGGRDGAFIVYDRGVPRQLLDAVKAYVGASTRVLGYLAGRGEGVKDLGWVKRLWEALLSSGATRGSVIVAVGGGALLDAAGFAASTYMRGLDLASIPTTSLAMMDAAVGGKTAVNLGGFKNVVGTYHHPRMVVADVKVLRELPHRVFLQGLAEAVKHAALESKARLVWLESGSREVLERDVEALTRLVDWSLSFKMSVVERDYREGGWRRVLNLGHTVGHALESASGFTLPHGEAVAMGLSVEAELSVDIAGLSPGEAEDLRATLRSYGLPTEPPKDLLAKAAGALRADKKRVGDKIVMPLLEAIGKPVLVEVGVGELESWLKSKASS